MRRCRPIALLLAALLPLAAARAAPDVLIGIDVPAARPGAAGRSLVLRNDGPRGLPGATDTAPTQATLDATRRRLEDKVYAGVDLGRVVVEGFGLRPSPEEILRDSLNKPDRPFRSLADRNAGLREDRDSFGLRSDCIAAQGPFACTESIDIGRKSKEHWMNGR